MESPALFPTSPRSPLYSGLFSVRSRGNNGLHPVISALGRLPRTRLGHAPTAIERMPNLERATGAECAGVALYVKRDDCTGLAFGGNKVRQLEFYLGEAKAANADTILITGAVQSNFVRLAAAAARQLGMDCHIQLEERVAKDDPGYRLSGNVLLDKLLGATLHSYPHGEDEFGADAKLREIADQLAAAGRRPYVVPLAPGHKPLGALGYVVAAEETLAQIASQELEIGEIVVASGSGNTHAGLLFGLRALGSPIRVTGVCVRREAAAQRERIRDRVREVAALLSYDPVVEEVDIVLDDRFLAPGYGCLNDAAIEAMRLAAQCEALILDPVYTAKTLASMIALVRDNDRRCNRLFLHTGGTPAVFAYGQELMDALSNAGE